MSNTFLKTITINSIGLNYLTLEMSFPTNDLKTFKARPNNQDKS